MLLVLLSLRCLFFWMAPGGGGFCCLRSFFAVVFVFFVLGLSSAGLLPVPVFSCWFVFYVQYVVLRLFFCCSFFFSVLSRLGFCVSFFVLLAVFVLLVCLASGSTWRRVPAGTR